MPTKLYEACYSRILVGLRPFGDWLAGFELEFYAKDGRKEALGENELKFFTAKFWKKPLYFPFIAARLARNASFRAFYLIAKGFAKTLLRKTTKSGALSQKEHYAMVTGVIGLEPVLIKNRDFGICVEAGSEQEFTTSFFHFLDVVFLNQYCACKGNMEGKTVVDAGANAGIFSILAARLGAKKVYAFEPVRESFEILERNIALNKLGKKIVPINMALGRREGAGKISYKFGIDGAASIAFFNPADHVQGVRITAIDHQAKRMGKVGFIKIDSEGFEAEILRGARKSIQKHKPILSFSAYHKPGDKAALPNLVKSIRNDYSCKLVNRGEEDFYCR